LFRGGTVVFFITEYNFLLGTGGTAGGGGGGGVRVLPENSSRGVRPLPKTLTLFMTKICDSPHPIYDLTKNLIPYLWPDSSCCWLYLACVAVVKQGRGRQSADGRGRA